MRCVTLETRSRPKYTEQVSSPATATNFAERYWLFDRDVTRDRDGVNPCKGSRMPRGRKLRPQGQPGDNGLHARFDGTQDAPQRLTPAITYYQRVDHFGQPNR